MCVLAIEKVLGKKVKSFFTPSTRKLKQNLRAELTDWLTA